MLQSLAHHLKFHPIDHQGEHQGLALTSRLVINFVLGLSLLGQFAFARGFGPNSNAYQLGSYLFEKTSTSLSDCPARWEAIKNSRWLCGESELEAFDFSQRWDNFMAVRPAGLSLQAISIWDSGKVAKLDFDWFKVYQADQGYYLAIYQSRPEKSAQVAFAFAESLDYQLASGPAMAEPSYQNQAGHFAYAQTGLSIIPEMLSIKGDIRLGSAQSPLILIEYADYNCPFCSQFHQESFAKLFENAIASGQVYYIYRQFISTGAEVTELSANASMCAVEQLDEPSRYKLLSDIYASEGQRNVRTVRDAISNINTSSFMALCARGAL
ncbi:MAG: thioredoxin domain-containing protein [Deinococcales bacterium]